MPARKRLLSCFEGSQTEYVTVPKKAAVPHSKVHDTAFLTDRQVEVLTRQKEGSILTSKMR